MNTIPLRAVVVGDGTLLIRCAEAALERRYALLAIVSADPVVAKWAADKGLPCLARARDLPGLLGDTRFEYLFSIGNLTVVPEDVLALPLRGAINFHDGPLPRYAGLYATSWALIGQETQHAVTWHAMTGEVDAGGIYVQRSFPIAPGETALSLNAKCYDAGLGSFVDLLDDLANGRAQAVPQDLAARTYFGRSARPAEACRISWKRTAREIDALVRALDFGPYPNPIGLPKIVLDGEWILVQEVAVVADAVASPAGTVTAAHGEELRVATAQGELALRRLATLDGSPLAVSSVIERHALAAGRVLTEPEPELRARLSEQTANWCVREPFWLERLSTLNPFVPPYVRRERARDAVSGWDQAPVPLSERARAAARRLGDDGAEDVVLAAFAAFLARWSQAPHCDVAFHGPEQAGAEAVFAPSVPLRIALAEGASLRAALAEIRKERQRLRTNGTFARDLVPRHPDRKALAASGGRVFPVGIALSDGPSSGSGELATELLLTIGPGGDTVGLRFDRAAADRETIEGFARSFAAFAEAILQEPDRSSAEAPVLDEGERRRLLHDWNPPVEPPVERCLHRLFEAQVARTPDRIALVHRDARLTYRELESRANRLARRLRALGVGPGALVGVAMEPSAAMVAGLLGILKAGGAYVPLDPAFPAERLAFVVQDAEIKVVLAAGAGPAKAFAGLLRVDPDDPETAALDGGALDGGAAPEDLAYVLYTSGTTGQPKGVMVEHRNVAGMFAAMDRSLEAQSEGAWLSVTTISFDISVLELFWPLTRGLRLVLHGNGEHVPARISAEPSPARPLGFSLFYFASQTNAPAQEEYRLLIEGAKFADRHGFEAVWMPERHFHAFGGLFPNPSVTAAAVAAVTQNVQVRAGSVVLPLHDPIRVAEEWSLVDNLSNGRVGISFASGWHADDFVFAPDAYPDRKARMLQGIETVRSLWRGEAIMRRSGSGEEVAIRILPRPVRPELPVWVTAAGNPETFRAAAQAGAHVLTHLLGQSLEEVAAKIAAYRAAWREAGHPGDGHVTLMLHTFVGDDLEAVRETVRGPFCDYLRSSVDLIRKAPSAFPTFGGPKAEADAKADRRVAAELEGGGIEGLLQHAFDRYFETSGLFGTPADCLRMVERLRGIGVDEIACLIDFGVDYAAVMQSLEKLDEVRRLGALGAAEAPASREIADEIHRHGVTHLQCTPSLARMLVADPECLGALGRLKHLLVGGEAFPPDLAATLSGAVSGELRNMYGPTEATIWSTSHVVNGTHGAVPIGRPLGNTEVYVLDRHRQPVPIGIPGEIFIGGTGVARGYWKRRELTQERFVAHPFRPGGRLYRTGDLGRFQPGGALEFLGRADEQVKIRGHRIELGEIAAVLAQLASVREAVVVAREESPGELRLVAYVVAEDRGGVPVAELEALAARVLPDYMRPSVYVPLAELPRTPNGKIDRKALPAPDLSRRRAAGAFVAPRTEVERALAEIWSSALAIEAIGIHDNFFDLGGHSLSAVNITFRVREAFHTGLSLQSFLQSPTIAQLAEQIEAAILEDAEDPEVARLLDEIESLSDEAARDLAKPEPGPDPTATSTVRA